MEKYTKEYIKEINATKQESIYLPENVVGSKQYPTIRIEVKLAYVALLNVLLASPLYTKDGKAYIKVDNPMVIKTLEELANKAVDRSKIKGYVEELIKLDFVEVEGQNLFVMKVN